MDKHKTELFAGAGDRFQVRAMRTRSGRERALLLYSRVPAPRLRACNGGVEVEARGLDLQHNPMQSIASLARILEGELANATAAESFGRT